MTDEKEKPPLPDQAALKKAMHDLLSDLAPNERGGWNAEGIKKPIVGKIEDGVRIITYSFDTPASAHHYKDYVHNTRVLDTDDQAIVRETLAKIEKVANIKFRLTEKGLVPDIAYSCGIMKNPNNDGLQQDRDILLDIVSPRTVLHETLHSLGLSDVGKGHTSHYTQDHTIMSNKPGKLQADIRDYDKAVLQYLYGAPITNITPTTQPAEISPNHGLPAATQPSKHKR